MATIKGFFTQEGKIYKYDVTGSNVWISDDKGEVVVWGPKKLSLACEDAKDLLREHQLNL